ncbi:hypothetical protein Clacol_002333 [Clathrus columnatus]|uniref:Uncharacterized protein n=1 Tax=Clathrus columnatus TaxID=1419009 RepID=A0AAV5A893_9AGAM|nr:hypothetical protein Clacol_002333 [Clathrus columnatus]
MAENPDCIIISDEEIDELNLHANLEQKKKPIISEEVIPDSEEENGPIRSLPIISPHTPPRQPKQFDEYPSSPLSPLPIPEEKKKKKKRKLLKDITLPDQPIRKKVRPSKTTVPPQYSSDSPVLNVEKPASPPRTPTHTPKPRVKPKPKPKAKPRKHKDGSDASPNVQETPLTPLLQSQIDRESPEPPKAQTALPSRETQRSDHESDVQNETSETLKLNSNRKEQHYQTKENPPPPQPVSKHIDDISSLVYTKKNNRPLTDILRNLNNNQSSLYTRRFSPAVSRNFLTRIAPLHPNRREPPPPPPPRIIPKKTKKEIEREEKWEEELQDSISNWCELTEEERQRFRKEKRDWELGLYEE